MNRLVFAGLLALFAGVFFTSTGAVLAQSSETTEEVSPPISLIADHVDFDPTSNVLIASGNVQVFRGKQVLATDKLIYDQRNKQLSIPGPMTLTDGDDVVTRATGAKLESNLETGLIEGAEVLIAQQLQLVSTRLHRQSGKFKVFDKVVATSCHVCAKNPVPFWRIRSKRVIHDETARRLYFEGATVDLLGVPIFHAPNLRIPDPTVNRATGMLVPKFSTSNTLGYGIEVPYYWTLGDHADFTLTGRAFSKGSFLLNPEYRRRMKNGRFEVNAHFTIADQLTDRSTRSSLQASGLFQLPKDIELEFEIDLASDKSFRDDYDIGILDKDRLTSFLTFRRTRTDSFASISTSYIQSLRLSEIDTQIPLVLPEIYARKTWGETVTGGKFGLTVQSVSLLREGGSKFTRTGLVADWQSNWILSNGLIVEAYGGVAGSSYYTENYTGGPNGKTTAVVPTASLDVRYPLSRQNGSVTHVIEPRIQLVWSEDAARSNPNEDSVQLEFDETNLFSTNRFPGFDATERGLRANIGLTYTRYNLEGWAYGLTLGRVFRAKDLNQFGPGTGLDGRHSDYVSAVDVSYQDRFRFVNKMLFDEDFGVSKNETWLEMNFDKFSTQATYVWLEQDVVAGASDRSHEASLAIQYRQNDYWTYLGEWRHNLETGHSTSGEFGIRYENECIAVNLSLSLQFEGSGIVRPTRELGLTVELAGLGNKKRNRKYARRCSAL